MRACGAKAAQDGRRRFGGQRLCGCQCGALNIRHCILICVGFKSGSNAQVQGFGDQIQPERSLSASAESRAPNESLIETKSQYYVRSHRFAACLAEYYNHIKVRARASHLHDESSARVWAIQPRMVINYTNRTDGLNLLRMEFERTRGQGLSV